VSWYVTFCNVQIRVLKEVEYFKDVTVRFGSVLFAVLPSSNLAQHSEIDEF
jgi:hypothetical protein